MTRQPPTQPALAADNAPAFASKLTKAQLMKMLTPRFAPTVALPSQIKIPVSVAIATGMPRIFTLIHGLKLPAGVVEFMLTDIRYRNWFIGDPLAGLVVEQQPNPVAAPQPDPAVEQAANPVVDPAVEQAADPAADPVVEQIVAPVVIASDRPTRQGRKKDHNG